MFKIILLVICINALCRLAHTAFLFFLKNFYLGGHTMTSKKTKEVSRNYYTVTDIKNILKISQSAAYELTHRKDFPVCRFGGTIRIPEDAFWNWVEDKTYIPTTLSLKGVS